MTLSEEHQITLALQALQSTKTLSIRKAAKIYNISRTTLSRRKKGRSDRDAFAIKTRKLTILEEDVVLQRILDLDSQAFSPRLREVADMANLLLRDRDAERVGINWASRFVQRQPLLKTVLSRKYDYQRALCEDPKIIRPWFDLVRNFTAKYGIPEDDIYNFDETGFMMGQIQPHMVVTRSDRVGKPHLAQPGNREWATAIQAINALGWAVPPYLIVKGQYHLASWTHDNHLPLDWRIAVSKNGWTTNEIGLDWIKHFDQSTKTRVKGKYRLLILDGHESHHSMEFESYCRDNDIKTLCMPPHSSHILQPLDVGVFGPLKTAYGRQIEHLMKARITYITKEDFFPAFLEAFNTSITQENIQGGFRGAGLVPLDAKRVLSKLDVRLLTPTPPGTPLELPTVWESKTPNNPIEATSQSEYLRNRVIRHQNSSPSPILDGINKIAKGTQRVMHEVAILREEVATLRKANEALSKRRRAKKTRLRQGGSLNVQESQDIVAQQEVNSQITQEEHLGRGRKPRDKTRVRRCGICGKTGHNARTCQIVVEPSSSDTGSISSSLNEDS